VWLALALLLPLLYAFALAARRPAPILEALPPALDGGSPPAGGAAAAGGAGTSQAGGDVAADEGAL
jgi:hypothetical protein